MKRQLNNLVSSAAGAALFVAACVIAALGFSLILSMALFGLAAIGIAILVSPLLKFVQPPEDSEAAKATA